MRFSANQSARIWLLTGILVCVGAALLGLKFGAVSDLSAQWVWELRWPRIVLALGVGGALAVAGAVLQTVFNNPLCDPYVLGISSGSALGAVLGAFLGLNLEFAGLAGSAFLGAVVFTLFLMLTPGRDKRQGNALLLSGVMLGLIGSSGVSLVMTLSGPAGVQGALFWLLGDLSRAQITGAWSVCAGVIVVLVILLRRSKVLDSFLLGTDSAESLGVDVARERLYFVALSTLLVAIAVSAAGMIGFLGFVVPHFIRRAVGAIHIRVLPLCFVWGGAVLVLADVLARSLAPPKEISVGVVTAIVGAPLFLWILRKGEVR